MRTDRTRRALWAFGSFALFSTDARGEEALPAHAQSVANYTLRARLDPETHVVQGEGTLTFTNTSRRAVHSVWMHLYLNAFRSTQSTFFRDPAHGGRGGAALTDPGFVTVKTLSVRTEAGVRELWGGRRANEDETDVELPLPEAIPQGETRVFDMVFEAKLPAIIERTGYAGTFHFVGQWFPKIARLEEDGVWAHFPFHHYSEFYADFGRYDVTITVPDTFSIAATGPRVEETRANGLLTVRHVQDDIIDFAFAAWDKFETREERIDDIAVRAFYPPHMHGMAERELAALRFAIPHFRERYGPYPYPVLTVVHPPSMAREAGGMEYPTLITTGGHPLTPSFVFAPEILTLHEFGHQYFYGLVATHEARFPFLDEGINSYAEAEAMRSWKGAASAVDGLDLSIGLDAISAALAKARGVDSAIARPASEFTSGVAYAGLVYHRTSTILDSLGRTYGRDKVRDGLGSYARRYRFSHPDPEAFLAEMGKVLPPEATSLLREALFERGWVDFAVHGIQNDKTPEGTFRSTALVTRRGTLPFPTTIRLHHEDGSDEVRMLGADRTEWSVTTEGKSPLAAAEVDPDGNVTLDQDRTNNAVSQKKTRATGVWERLLYVSELLFEAVFP